MYARVLAISCLMAFLVVQQAAAQDRSRWEFIPTGSSGLGSQQNATGVPPSLTGTDANFLFRLDQMIKAPPKTSGKLDMHMIFDIGVINPARGVTTRTDPASSPALQALGATSSVAATTAGTSVSHERAFSAGGQFTINWLPNAAKDDENFIEFGAVFKGHFDSFFDNQRLEKDGITYIKLNEGAQSESSFFRGETGLRLRVTHKNQGTDVTLQDNADDLLLLEGLIQRAGALRDLSRQINANAANRYVFRFMALPGVNPTNFAAGKNTNVRNRY